MGRASGLASGAVSVGLASCTTILVCWHELWLGVRERLLNASVAGWSFVHAARCVPAPKPGPAAITSLYATFCNRGNGPDRPCVGQVWQIIYNSA